jgi:hypothetical protein
MPRLKELTVETAALSLSVLEVTTEPPRITPPPTKGMHLSQQTGIKGYVVGTDTCGFSTGLTSRYTPSYSGSWNRSQGGNDED